MKESTYYHCALVEKKKTKLIHEGNYFSILFTAKTGFVQKIKADREQIGMIGSGILRLHAERDTGITPKRKYDYGRRLSKQTGRRGRFVDNHCFISTKLKWAMLPGGLYWGQYGAHLGPTGPRWAPCCPHEPCYLGTFFVWSHSCHSTHLKISSMDTPSSSKWQWPLFNKAFEISAWICC